MQNSEIVLVTLVLATTLLCSTVIGEGIDRLDGDVPVESILETIRQSSAPARTMQVKWTYETVDPTVFYFIKPGFKMPDETPQELREYVVTVSGIRSRIDSLEKTFKTSESEEPYDVRRSTAVFNGTQQRRLENKIKGEGRTLLGWQYLRDKNSNLLSKMLFGWPFDLNNRELLAKYSFNLLESPAPGIYVLEGRKGKGTSYHFTIDGNKGFNIVKIECFLGTGAKDYETNFKLKQYNDEIWYIAEREQMRYPQAGREAQPHIEYKMRVTQAQFNIDVPEETFELEFPHGTKVWDGITQDWLVIGGPEQPLFEGRPLEEPTPNKADNQADFTQSTPESPPAGNSPMQVRDENRQPTPLAQTPEEHTNLIWFLVLLAVVVISGLIVHRVRTEKANKQRGQPCKGE
ncbi:MAG TPA: hypothetical protein VMX13_07430 [Sedimentisphaerales bacterium]|nr:hypothetical protein [Sedimentisphaerales bacterium]